MERRTFKEKLSAELAAAKEEEAADAAANTRLSDSKELLIDLLVRGRPLAFIELYRLVHPAQGGVGAAPSEESEETAEDAAAQGDESSISPRSTLPAAAPGASGSVPREHLPRVSDWLQLAEEASRTGDPAAVGDRYADIAHFFESVENYQQAAAFHAKRVSVAEASSDARAELAARRALGVAVARCGDTAGAVGHHERQFAIAGTLEDADALEDAGRSLVNAYEAAAEAQAKNLQLRVALFEKMRERASELGDHESEGRAHNRLGETHMELGEPLRAAEHHTKHRELCAQLKDKVGEGIACRGLAVAHRALGDDDAAVSNLESFLELAKGGEPHGQALACDSLGSIYQAQGRYERSATYFEKSFELSRSLESRSMSDKARVALGVARGSSNMERFFEAVKSDANALISWKNVRMPLEKLEDE